MKHVIILFDTWLAIALVFLLMWCFNDSHERPKSSQELVEAIVQKPTLEPIILPEPELPEPTLQVEVVPTPEPTEDTRPISVENFTANSYDEVNHITVTNIDGLSEKDLEVVVKVSDMYSKYNRDLYDTDIAEVVSKSGDKVTMRIYDTDYFYIIDLTNQSVLGSYNDMEFAMQLQPEPTPTPELTFFIGEDVAEETPEPEVQLHFATWED